MSDKTIWLLLLFTIISQALTFASAKDTSNLSPWIEHTTFLSEHAASAPTTAIASANQAEHRESNLFHVGTPAGWELPKGIFGKENEAVILGNNEKALDSFSQVRKKRTVVLPMYAHLKDEHALTYLKHHHIKSPKILAYFFYMPQFYDELIQERILTIIHDITDTRLPDGSVDTVSILFPNPLTFSDPEGLFSQYLQEVYRILKDDGLLYVMTDLEPGRQHPLNFGDYDSLKQMLEKAGFIKNKRTSLKKMEDDLYFKMKFIKASPEVGRSTEPQVMFLKSL